MSAEDGKAASVMLCGQGKCERGFFFLQIQNESATTLPLRLVMGKDYNCGYDSCVYFKFFNPDGSEGFNGAIPDDETTANFTLGQAIQTDKITFDFDNEWLLKVVVYWKDKDDVMRKSYGFAYLRVNVVEKTYEFLSCGDPLTAWRVPLKEGCEVHYSTGFRSAKCGDKCGG
jgi:hypothetical protein